MVRLTLPLISLSVLLLGSEASFLRFGAVVEPQAPESPDAEAPVIIPTGGRDLSSATLKVVGNNGSPSGSFPLGLCEGDCDSDAECEGNLVCFERSPGDGAVPGCSGSNTKGLDFCVDPQALGNAVADDGEDDYNGGEDGNSGGSGNASGQSSSFAESVGPSLFKMHWEEWYYWQEETVERKWCIQSLGNDSGSRARIYNCDSGEASLLVFERQFTDEAFQIRVSGENICLQKPDTSEDYCYFDTCDGSEAQKWVGRNGNAFGGGTFQLSPASERGNCLTITHHPRETEQLWVAVCGYAETYHTSLWAPYQINS